MGNSAERDSQRKILFQILLPRDSQRKLYFQILLPRDSQRKHMIPGECCRRQKASPWDQTDWRMKQQRWSKQIIIFTEFDQVTTKNYHWNHSHWIWSGDILLWSGDRAAVHSQLRSLPLQHPLLPSGCKSFQYGLVRWQHLTILFPSDCGKTKKKGFDNIWFYGGYNLQVGSWTKSTEKLQFLANKEMESKVMLIPFSAPLSLPLALQAGNEHYHL